MVVVWNLIIIFASGFYQMLFTISDGDVFIIDTNLNIMRNIIFIVLALLLPSMIMAESQTDSRNVDDEVFAACLQMPVVDHEGLCLNPTPQKIERGDSYLAVIDGFRIKDVKNSFGENVGFLKTSVGGITISIDFGNKVANKAGVAKCENAYRLSIDKKGVRIIGRDRIGAFYGLQTLRQILESPVSEGGTRLPWLTIFDYPELKNRGTVEGFYGVPWSHEVRLSLIDFMGRNKMNRYVYGPKDDIYHRNAWREPYPEEDARKLKELVEASRRNCVNFVWAIHPGADYKWNESDYDILIKKFNSVYDMGVRHFGIFFDDIQGEGTNSTKQAELLNSIIRDFVKEKGDVDNMIVCPTDYSQAWANPGPKGQLATYGNLLDSGVDVFWTGHEVCSNIDASTMDFVNSRIKRPALVWWNYPVTDYCTNVVLQGPVYGLENTLTSADLAGILTNPMEQGEASKLAFYGVADYSWNPDAYNPLDNWERGLATLMPEATEAYRTFAQHSATPPKWMFRSESWETALFSLDEYTPEKAAVLKAEFGRMASAAATIRMNATNKALVEELNPWLTQLEALGKRCRSVIELMEMSVTAEPANFWNLYLSNVMSPDELVAYGKHTVGSARIQPFYEESMKALLSKFIANPDAPKVMGEKMSRIAGDIVNPSPNDTVKHSIYELRGFENR